MSTSATSVVIIGAGFGGLAAAHTLAKARRKDLKLTVIDRSDFHVFTPLLYEAATGFIEHENIGSAALLRTGISVGNAALLSRWGADFVNDEVEGIDWDGKRVLLRSGGALPFDRLIVAPGAETNFYGIPGLQEHAHTLKSLKDSDRLRQRIHDVLHKLEAGKDADRKFNLVIGGAGATGVELAAEVTMFLRRHLIKNHIKPEDFSVTIVEAQPRILGAMDGSLASFALERLRRLGVRVHLDSAVKEVGLGRVTLVPRACKPGETVDQLLCDFRKEGSMEIAADIVVWTGGIRGSSSLERLGIPLDPRGKRIEVGPSLEVPGRPGVFAIGDAALLIDPSTKQPVPWLAQAAMAMGKTVARTMLNRLDGRPDAAYRFAPYPVIVPLGGKFAVAKAGSLVLKGFWGWLLKEAANLRYFLSILPFVAAARLWWHGAKIYSKND